MLPFIDLATQRKRIGPEIEQAISRVLAHGNFILGPEVSELESRLAGFADVAHVVSCASGTDALALVLMAKGVKPGDAVLCPTFTFCATAEVVARLNATPIFVDSDPATFNMKPESLVEGLATARRLGLHPAGVIPVDLFGLPADYGSILPIAERHELWVLADAAQAFGATSNGRRVGGLCTATATSFFPAKPLGCYGDGGAVLTTDPELAGVLRSLRVHGQGSHKYENVRIGATSRLDTMQAAVLLQKLDIFEDELRSRNAVAARYSAGLGDVVRVPHVPAGSSSAWAQYTIAVDPRVRASLADKLKARGIPFQVYYPIPLHRQKAYSHYPVAGGGLPVAERLCEEVLSLPMHPYLEAPVQDRIIGELRSALGAW